MLQEEKEAEEFISSVLEFIQQSADRFDTDECFIEDCILDIIKHIKQRREEEKKNENFRI